MAWRAGTVGMGPDDLAAPGEVWVGWDVRWVGWVALQVGGGARGGAGRVGCGAGWMKRGAGWVGVRVEVWCGCGPVGVGRVRVIRLHAGVVGWGART